MTKTLTKASLIEIVLASSEKIAKPEAKALIETFFSTLKDRLIDGEMVKISGFGNFVLHDKKARPGRNPKTGKAALIEARRVVTFRSGDKLKKRVASLPESDVK